MLEVLLFGGTGQLGRALRAQLTPMHALRLHSPTRAQCDLRDKAALTSLIQSTNPGLIINAAAYNDIDGAERMAEATWAVNAEAPALMARTLGALKQGHLLHFSSDYVFDGSARRPYREDAPAAPQSVYARSKWAAEQALRTSGTPHTLLRIGWLYSEYGNNLLTRTLKQLLDPAQSLEFVDDQYGTPTNCATVAAFVGSVWLPRLNSMSGMACFHLRCAGSTSRYGFARAIQDSLRTLPHSQDHWQRPIKPVPHTNYSGSRLRPSYSVLCDARVRAAFNYRPPSWRSALRSTLRSMQLVAQPATNFDS